MAPLHGKVAIIPTFAMQSGIVIAAQAITMPNVWHAYCSARMARILRYATSMPCGNTGKITGIA
jgi:hypothetical protein